MFFSNVYFITGNAYAGKSTMVELLAKEYNGYWCKENYHNSMLDKLDKNEYPNLCYTRDLVDFHDFIRRSPDEYEKWVNEVSKECERIELILLDEISKKEDIVFVDTNISIETLKKICEPSHVLIMLADPQISVRRFFERSDKDKQFLYKLIMEEKDSKAAMYNFRKCLERINSIDNYNEYLNSGFNVIIRDENRTVKETLEIVKKCFKLK